MSSVGKVDSYPNPLRMISMMSLALLYMLPISFFLSVFLLNDRTRSKFPLIKLNKKVFQEVEEWEENL